MNSELLNFVMIALDAYEYTVWEYLDNDGRNKMQNDIATVRDYITDNMIRDGLMMKK
jgi:hypothetical protein